MEAALQLLTIFGVVISLSSLVRLVLHGFRHWPNESTDDAIQIIRQSKPPRLAKGKSHNASTVNSRQTADFRLHRKEGKICWRTGMCRNSCKCKGCNK